MRIDHVLLADLGIAIAALIAVLPLLTLGPRQSLELTTLAPAHPSPLKFGGPLLLGSAIGTCGRTRKT